jgi:hypothetical protein
MKKSTVMIAAAALSGLVAGTAARGAVLTSGSDSVVSSTAQRALSAQAGTRVNLQATTAPAIHDCAGKNGCKGTGGCKTSDGGCKGKNSCKGKGGCKTSPSL